jgi:hypothetical protein
MRRLVVWILVALLLTVATALGGVALFQYRSDKIEGQSEHARRAWARIHVGSEKRSVRSLAGSPSAAHGSCWAWGEGWVFDAATVFRVCFDQRDRVVRKERSNLYSD